MNFYFFVPPHSNVVCFLSKSTILISRVSYGQYDILYVSEIKVASMNFPLLQNLM